MSSEYNTSTEPRAVIGVTPVFCAYDEIIPISKAVPNPLNPNRHPDKQINLLAEIIKQQGWRAPITISTRSGYIVRGHGRLMAARLLGLESVPADFQSYESDEAEKADMLADNRIAEFSNLDEEILAELLNEISDSDIDMELTGFDFEEVSKLLEKELERTEPQTFSYDVDYDPEYKPTVITSEVSSLPPSDYASESLASEIQRNQSQTGEIDIDSYDESHYQNECPKCKFKW